MTNGERVHTDYTSNTHTDFGDVNNKESKQTPTDKLRPVQLDSTTDVNKGHCTVQSNSPSAYMQTAISTQRLTRNLFQCKPFQLRPRCIFNGLRSFVCICFILTVAFAVPVKAASGLNDIPSEVTSDLAVQAVMHITGFCALTPIANTNDELEAGNVQPSVSTGMLLLCWVRFNVFNNMSIGNKAIIANREYRQFLSCVQCENLQISLSYCT